MSGNFAGFLAFAIVFMVFFTIAGAMIYFGPERKDKKGIGVAMFITGTLVCVATAFAFYNLGQHNKTLPNVKSHHGVVVMNMQFKLGEDYRPLVAKYSKVYANSGASGSIIVQYSGGAQPITIAIQDGKVVSEPGRK